MDVGRGVGERGLARRLAQVALRAMRFPVVVARRRQIAGAARAHKVGVGCAALGRGTCPCEAVRLRRAEVTPQGAISAFGTHRPVVCRPKSSLKRPRRPRAQIDSVVPVTE